MKAEYDRICFVKPVPQAANATKRFCDAFKNNCKNLIKVNLVVIQYSFTENSDFRQK